MRKVYIVLLLFSFISVVFGFYNRTELAGVNRKDREDIDIDIDNNVADTNSMTIDEINLTYVLNTPEGVDCMSSVGKGNGINSNVCLISKEYHGPFYYGDYKCYLTETFSGANERMTYANGSDYYRYYIDMNGYMKCKIDGKWFDRYRKFNWFGEVGPATSEEILENLNLWSNTYNNLFSGENYFKIGKVTFWITISKCTSVFSTYTKPVTPANCNAGK